MYYLTLLYNKGDNNLSLTKILYFNSPGIHIQIPIMHFCTFCTTFLFEIGSCVNKCTCMHLIIYRYLSFSAYSNKGLILILYHAHEIYVFIYIHEFYVSISKMSSRISNQRIFKLFSLFNKNRRYCYLSLSIYYLETSIYRLSYTVFPLSEYVVLKAVIG